MHMRMVLEVLAPSVQHSGDADVGAKVLGIASNGGERLGCGREQQSVELGLVLVGDGSERSRQREHHMEVRHWQEFSLARCHPCLSGRPPGTSGSGGGGRGGWGSAGGGRAPWRRW